MARRRLHYDARLDGGRGACVIEDRREADDLGCEGQDEGRGEGEGEGNGEGEGEGEGEGWGEGGG